MMGGCGILGLLAGLVGVLLFAGSLGVVVLAAVGILPARGALSGRTQPRTDPAEETLRERFARGEVGAEEFGKALRTLRREPARRLRGFRSGGQRAVISAPRTACPACTVPSARPSPGSREGGGEGRILRVGLRAGPLAACRSEAGGKGGRG